MFSSASSSFSINGCLTGSPLDVGGWTSDRRVARVVRAGGGWDWDWAADMDARVVRVVRVVKEGFGLGLIEALATGAISSGGGGGGVGEGDREPKLTATAVSW